MGFTKRYQGFDPSPFDPPVNCAKKAVYPPFFSLVDHFPEGFPAWLDSTWLSVKVSSRATSSGLAAGASGVQIGLSQPQSKSTAVKYPHD